MVERQCQTPIFDVLYCRCTHLNLQQEKFTYDPTRPADQFITFVRLTFANGLKKAGLVESQSFHFTDILYRGRDIHHIMRDIERERFIVPKETFMRINRRQLALPRNVSSKTEAEKRKLDNGSQMESPVRPSGSRGGNSRGRGRGRPRKYL